MFKIIDWNCEHPRGMQSDEINSNDCFELFFWSADMNVKKRKHRELFNHTYCVALSFQHYNASSHYQIMFAINEF